MHSTTKAHGLDGTLVEPDWPPLQWDEVREVLSRFPSAGAPTKVLRVSPRPFSAASLIETETSAVFVKRHHVSVRDLEGLREEHRFMAHLRAHGAPVPRVLETECGATTVEAGEWTYEIHERQAGVDLYGDAVSWTPFRSPQHAYSAGQALARMHVASLGFDAAPRKARPLVASFTIFAAQFPADELQRYLEARPALKAHALARERAAEALELLDPFHAELAPLLPLLRPLWTHNDMHASNLFWSDSCTTAQATAVIDFGLSDRTNAVHDLAHAIERNIVEWLHLVQKPNDPNAVPTHLDHMRALLDGYESVRPLNAEERAALAPLTALCHAEFALSEADYFLGILRDEDKAAAAYDGWLVGHARWFRSDAGARLLDGLRDWAKERSRNE